MQQCLLKSKIHRAPVTGASLHYEGSLAIDEALAQEVGLLPYEKILVANMSNGARFETYIIYAPAGTKIIQLNGAAARLGEIGDLLTIMAYGWFDPEEAAKHHPKVLTLLKTSSA